MTRMLKMLFIIPLCLLSTMTIIYLLAKTEPLFSLKNIKINGADQLGEKDVMGRISPFLKESLLKVDVAKIRETIASHPFVREASIRRVFPFSIVIDVKEKRPSALWVTGEGDVQVLDETGEPYKGLSKGEGSGLFLISSKSRKDVKSIYGEVDGWHKEGIIKKETLSEVVYNEGNITLFGVEDGVEIILGKEDQKLRLKKAIAVLDDARKRGLLIKCIDARFERGAIIQERKG
jgi:cell division protein FtsQ